MMATKPPDGNERLDAHLRCEFVQDLCKETHCLQAEATRNEPP